ncbi:hypothetical protein C8Q77DRAFT_1147718 [Trametes polyzona]|nr:hypothetical protein C8Q77DRAFT_1147718 [Trametes polyzona]
MTSATVGPGVMIVAKQVERTCASRESAPLFRLTSVLTPALPPARVAQWPARIPAVLCVVHRRPVTVSGCASRTTRRRQQVSSRRRGPMDHLCLQPGKICCSREHQRCAHSLWAAALASGRSMLGSDCTFALCPDGLVCVLCITVLCTYLVGSFVSAHLESDLRGRPLDLRVCAYVHLRVCVCTRPSFLQWNEWSTHDPVCPTRQTVDGAP